VLTVSARGVRRLNVRNWEKAVADGNVEQMFGMNIKQEGIEVLGDQVSINPMHRSNDFCMIVRPFLVRQNGSFQTRRTLSLAGHTSGAVLWNSFTTPLRVRRPRTSKTSPKRTASLDVTSM
jgi:hypothetical protein